MTLLSQTPRGLTLASRQPIILQMSSRNLQETASSMSFDPAARTRPCWRIRMRTLWTLVWLGLLWLAGPPAVPAASPRIQIENLRVGFGGTNAFKVGTWTPVWIQLR